MKNKVLRLLTGGLCLMVAISCNTQPKRENEPVVKPELQQTKIKQVYQVGDKVPNELVCMVNDTYMGKQQIAVPVNGKIYYGCCEMCVKKLKEQEDARTAIDPQSGKKVDKVEAYIVLLNEQGTVGYFESQNNYEIFISK